MKVKTEVLREDLKIFCPVIFVPPGVKKHQVVIPNHQLLIDDSKKKSYITTKAFKISKSIVWVFISLPILFLWLVALVLKPFNKNIDYKSIFVYPKEKIERK